MAQKTESPKELEKKLIKELMELDGYFADEMKQASIGAGEESWNYKDQTFTMQKNIDNDFPLFFQTSIGVHDDMMNKALSDASNKASRFEADSIGRLSQIKALTSDLEEANRKLANCHCELIGLGPEGEGTAHIIFGIGETVRQKLELDIQLSEVEKKWMLNNLNF